MRLATLRPADCVHEDLAHPESGVLRDTEWPYWPVDIDLHLRNVERLAAATLEARNAEERWLAYLDSLVTRQLTTPEAADASDQLWTNLYEIVPSLVPPDASPTTAGGLLMSWDDRGRHLELEVLPHGSYEWFYRERLPDIAEGGEAASIDIFDDKLLRRLQQLAS